ncbi:MAG: hypothetical protein AAGB22_15925, partial [Bacteroidota bacterium]
MKHHTLMKYALGVCACLVVANAFSQVAQPEVVRVPKNPWLVDSPWPIYHANGARQAYTEFAGPSAGDSVVVQVLEGIKGGTSPWTYFSEPYPNGQRALLQSNATHYVKLLDGPNGPRVVSTYRIDKDWLRSFSYNHLQVKGNQFYTVDPKNNPRKHEYSRMLKLGDKDPSDPNSPLVLKKTFHFGQHGIGKTQHTAVNYRGEIIFASDNEKG